MPSMTYPFTYRGDEYEIEIDYEIEKADPEVDWNGAIDWSVSSVPKTCPITAHEVDAMLDAGTVEDAIDEHEREALR